MLFNCKKCGKRKEINIDTLKLICDNCILELNDYEYEELILERALISIILEKHEDFFRFRRNYS